MKTYTIAVTYTLSNDYKVEASSVEDAIAKFKQANLNPSFAGDDDTAIRILLLNDLTTRDKASLTATEQNG